MEALLALAYFCLGAVLASFAGVLASRLHTGTSVVVGRSRCDVCDRELSAPALIPILSFIQTRGRALCCGARIHPGSTLGEVVLGTLFVLTYLTLTPGIGFALFLVALTLLLALVLYDLQHAILPPVLLGFFALASLGVALMVHQAQLLETMVVAVGVAAFLALIHVASSGRAMGLADAPLAFSLALLVGPAALSGFIFSFWIGALIGITLLVREAKGATISHEVPFAPFLAAGFLLAYFTSWNPFIIVGELLLRLSGA